MTARANALVTAGTRPRPASCVLGDLMYAGGSLFLIAIGAILYWAVTFHIRGVNLPMVGLILMVIGVVGVLFSLIGAATRRRPT